MVDSKLKGGNSLRLISSTCDFLKDLKTYGELRRLNPAREIDAICPSSDLFLDSKSEGKEEKGQERSQEGSEEDHFLPSQDWGGGVGGGGGGRGRCVVTFAALSCPRRRSIHSQIGRPRRNPSTFFCHFCTSSNPRAESDIGCTCLLDCVSNGHSKTSWLHTSRWGRSWRGSCFPLIRPGNETAIGNRALIYCSIVKRSGERLLLLLLLLLP